MTDALRDAAQQALGALEESVDLVRNDYATDWRHGLPSRKAQLDGMAEAVKAHQDAITALRAALAAPPVAPGWVPLTGVELTQIELRLRIYYDYDQYDLSLLDFARAIEAAHGITAKEA